jgi:hypothetical protein
MLPDPCPSIGNSSDWDSFLNHTMMAAPMHTLPQMDGNFPPPIDLDFLRDGAGPLDIDWLGFGDKVFDWS